MTGLSPSLAGKWRDEREAVKTDFASFSTACSRVAGLLRQRRNSPHNTVADDLGVAPSLSLAVLAEVIAEHNAGVATFAEQQQRAARRIADDILWVEVNEYRDLLAAQTEAVATVAAKSSDVEAARKLVTTLNVAETNPHPLALALTEGFANLFGRLDLTFEVEGSKYQILREGQPATKLSEGERNGIALLYFLNSLLTHGVDLSRSVVVIDDPISSMDDHIAFGVSSYIWTRLVGDGESIKCSQLFVLTHDFEFFRSWIHRLGNRPSEKRGKIFELRSGINDEGKTVSPTLHQWSSKERSTRSKSEYHYLFWRIAETLRACKDNSQPDADLEAMYLLPNTCRQLLEGFLGFKQPNQIGNFAEQVRKAAQSASNPEVADRVTRYLHQGSHNENPDTQKATRRNEAIPMLTAVMQFMYAVDEPHFRGMCKTAAQDPSILAPRTAPAIP